MFKNHDAVLHWATWNFNSPGDVRIRNAHGACTQCTVRQSLLGKWFTPVCLCHQAVQFGIGQRAVMLCGREGNCRSGITVAMQHRLVVYPRMGSTATEREMTTPYAPYWGTVHFI